MHISFLCLLSHLLSRVICFSKFHNTVGWHSASSSLSSTLTSTALPLSYLSLFFLSLRHKQMTQSVAGGSCTDAWDAVLGSWVSGRKNPRRSEINCLENTNSSSWQLVAYIHHTSHLVCLPLFFYTCILVIYIPLLDFMQKSMVSFLTLVPLKMPLSSNLTSRC